MEPNFISRNKYILIIWLIPNIMVLLGYYENYLKRDRGAIPFKKLDVINTNTEMKYIVETPNCKIPDIDPLNSDVWPYYQKEEYSPCTTLGLLTYVVQKEDETILKINNSLIQYYSPGNISCCYMNVSRGNEDDIDNGVSFSDCYPFEDKASILSDLIKVICHDTNNDEIYANVHSIIKLTSDVQKRMKPESDDSYSVLFVGIDTMSELNFMRTMPKTHIYLEQNGWINLKGYNKIDDNTFPNLMGILTGMNLTQIKDKCNPEDNTLDACGIVWEKFRDLGYITAYAEDEGYLNTFNFLMKGFEQPPTDYYFRPYFLAIETLNVVKKYLLSYCTGPETSGERILNVIKDFVNNFKDQAKFGLFWMNTFSHNNINTASGMDEVFVNFFRHLMESNALERTIMVFFSDHGFRFGKIRYTYSGWLEERLPFNYVWLPKSFQQAHSKAYDNFVTNSKRLTTPFDLYVTLQELLSWSNNKYKPRKSKACPKCKSLFTKVDEDRSCEDASISQHMCTCMGHFYIDPNSEIVKKAAEFALDKLRSMINSFKDGPVKCSDYYLRSVISSGITETFYNSKNQSFNYLLIIFETFPKAVFEATVSTSYQNSIPLFSLQGVISRIDRYGNTSDCVSDRILRKYCYCDGISTKFKKTMNILFNT